MKRFCPLVVALWFFPEMYQRTLQKKKLIWSPIRRIESPHMWAWPQLPFPPQLHRRALSVKPQPFPPHPPPLFPHPLALLAMVQDRAAHAGVREGRRARGGCGGGGSPKRHLGSDPHLGARFEKTS